ncbi:MAG: Arm DNA-binding domain [Acidobacteriota bacterium]|nr:Arm DNA-binding domain [Acidobacteriota bacterium]
MKMKLTEARIPTLRTGKPQEDIFHAATPGAGLRLTREGRKTWFLLYYAPGTPQKRRYSFGEHPSGKLGEARYLSLKTLSGSTPSLGATSRRESTLSASRSASILRRRSLSPRPSCRRISGRSSRKG